MDENPVPPSKKSKNPKSNLWADSYNPNAQKKLGRLLALPFILKPIKVEYLMEKHTNILC